ncbi:molybdopterin-dependent oxidoreductase [Pseudoponticoccus marisrubri]|uniref:Oxidoreductase n=1 Tax=Pseudoponticoccus marisrubri TaxID=1685382 RepID=A0A0W7WPT7_9RHOB|nr:molybdopterin-dependent oxidoreductase [Pseudoponticoccus marisrubri]KUF12602.1 oxidoreductase [Pseudoponticoccus marisrubri]
MALRTALLASAASLTAPAAADTLPEPQGRVVLTITGDIAHTNAEGAARFDVEMLRAIDETDIATETIWTEGENVFTGVRLDLLLAHVGAEGDEIEAKAINDYAVSIPVSDAVEDGPIIAYEMDGRPMPLREKGPLWVIYPYSSSSAYRTEVIYSRSIWQLDRLHIPD